jgi:quercetin dioxygenase-like cupin family protein
MPRAVISSFHDTVERTYPDGISTVRAIIGRRTDLPLGRNVPSPVLFSFGVATVNPGGEIAAHTHHDREELFYILAGTGRLEAGDEPPREVTAGDAIWFPIGCRHRLHNAGDQPVVLVFVGMTPSGASVGSERS